MIAAVEESEARSLTFARVVRAVRRHLLLAIAVSATAVAAALLLWRHPPLYQATAVVRLAGARRDLSAGVAGVSGAQEALPALFGRTPTPLLSLVPRMRSRTVAGIVVDSLGLQLKPQPAFSVRGALMPSTAPPVARFRDVWVDPTTRGDTLYLRFSRTEVEGRRGSRIERAPYGKPLRLGPARFTVPALPEVESVTLSVASRERAIDEVLSNLAVDPVQGTDALQVRYNDADPAAAQQVANLVVQTFLAKNILSSQEQAGRRRQFLAGQLQQTERSLAGVQAKLTAFRSRHQLGSSSEKLAAQQAGLMSLDSRRGELEVSQQVYRTILAQLESSDDSARAEGLRTLSYSPEIATDRIAERLYQQLLEYQTRLDSLTTGPWRSSVNSPDVRQLRELLSSSQQELVRALRAHLKSLEQRIDALARLRTQNADTMQAMPAVQAEETRLGQQVLALSSLADQLRLEHEKSRMFEELDAGDVEIVDLATLPYEPMGLPWLLTVGFAVLFGLPVGAGAATLLDMRNRSVRSPGELARIVPVPGLGVIPRLVEPRTIKGGLAQLGRNLNNGNATSTVSGRAVSDFRWPSMGLEAFRLLYTNLTLGWGERQRTILVTSVAPREGKTLIAANLAVTFARQGARVLLVDGDLRRPQLHKMFRVPRKPGLMELLVPAAADEGRLSGQPVPGYPCYSMFASLERPSDGPSAEVRATNPGVAGASGSGTSVRRTNIPGLFLLPCGSLPVDPGEPLQQGSMRRVLDGFAERFDVIILDSPPIMVSADAPMLGPLADSVLLVVQAGQTDRAAAEWAYQQLITAGASVVGTVLNDPGGEVARDRTLYYSYDYAAVPD
jgi:succinoglycan biosynthesis transport protein ExoP